MIKRTLGADPVYSYAISNAPASTPLRTFVWLSGGRWAIEQCFEEGKTELGMAFRLSETPVLLPQVIMTPPTCGTTPQQMTSHSSPPRMPTAFPKPSFSLPLLYLFIRWGTARMCSKRPRG